MNHLLIGTADKTERFLQLAHHPFLLIDDGPVADAFLEHFPKARLFDITKHSFNPLRGIDYKRARDFAAALYTANPEGVNTLTVRNGKRALIRMLLMGPERLVDLPDSSKDPGEAEAIATIQDMLLSPVLSEVLCANRYFKFTDSIVMKLDRAAIGDFDAFILASLLIGQHQGQIIVPDFGFYGRQYHTTLIRQERLMVGLQFLAELPAQLAQAVLSIKDKTGNQCLYSDAETLALYAGYSPDTTGYSDLVRRLMEP